MLRGLHPMMAHRLHLWRLSEFALERLPSAEDVYLFHGVARANPKDERLFALAEVRDLTPVRDDAGRVVALPELERMLVQALEGIRASRPTASRAGACSGTASLLHVWPVIDLTPEEIRALVAPPGAVDGRARHRDGDRAGRLREADGGERERVLRFFAPGPAA